MAGAGSSLSPAHVAAQMRRLFGNIGSAQHQDALAAQDMDNVSDEENFGARLAYRTATRAKKNLSDGGSRESTPKHSKGKAKNAVDYGAVEINR